MNRAHLSTKENPMTPVAAQVTPVQLSEYRVVFLDTQDAPVASCTVEAVDYLDACSVAHRISANAAEFEVKQIQHI